MGCKLNLSNKFSFLNSICAECDFNSCMCETVSQIGKTEDIYSMGHDVLKEEKEVYLMGDINRDLLNNNINKAWTEYMEPFGLSQLVSEATRVTNDTRTLIDHIYSNCPENVNSINVPKIGLSDHFPIFFTRKMHVHPPKTNHHTISYRSFRNFDEAKFVEDIQSVPWDTIKLFADTDDILEAWLDLFLQVVDKHVPL